jgi:hypothetical protein
MLLVELTANSDKVGFSGSRAQPAKVAKLTAVTVATNAQRIGWDERMVNPRWVQLSRRMWWQALHKPLLRFVRGKHVVFKASSSHPDQRQEAESNTARVGRY